MNFGHRKSHTQVYKLVIFADVVELADTQDLGSCIARCAGSSPVIRTTHHLTHDGHHLYNADTGL